ncbi:hypothetical protein CXG81DRAFT_3789, partial [Caulochytrium protostelioides]
VCEAYIRGYCPKGVQCPRKHERTTKTVVCKHWLRGLCKKGDMCEFLHEYNLKRMPECWFYTQTGECTNAECIYVHIDPKSKKSECPGYQRGFCHDGPRCRYKHTTRVLCPSFLVGFCPQGKECAF